MDWGIREGLFGHLSNGYAQSSVMPRVSELMALTTNSSKNTTYDQGKIYLLFSFCIILFTTVFMSVFYYSLYRANTLLYL